MLWGNVYKLKIIIVLLAINFLSTSIYSQSYFYEDFEDGTLPEGWDEQTLVGNTSWRYENGGAEDPFSYERFPAAAKSGIYNALFQIDVYSYRTMLITSPIDMSSSYLPELNFWHAQDEYGPSDFDKLKVWGKKSLSSSWVLLGSYLDLTPIWTLRSIFLPDSLLTSTFYLGFEGISDWGRGVCVDSITISERGVVPKQIRDYDIFNASTNLVPTGAKDVPLLGIMMDVFGNTGSMEFNSLTLIEKISDITDIDPAGIQLYHTLTPYFETTTPIETGIDAASPNITYSDLNFTLPYGKSYIWVTADVKSTAGYNDTLDLSVLENSMEIDLDTTGFPWSSDLYVEGDSVVFIVNEEVNKAAIHYTMPSETTSPSGYRLIKESVYYDDFEGVNEWTLSGDFEVTTPMGKGGSEGGNSDPSSAISGTNVIGTDLSGIGLRQGDYENSTPMYDATSKIVNCKYYRDVKLNCYLWLNKESFDQAYLSMSVDSGKNWTTIKNYTDISSYYWNNTTVNLSGFGADRKEYLQFRVVMGPTDISGTRSGWNIDNFAIVGDYLTKDIGLLEILSPVSGCGHSDHDTIRIVVKNYAALNYTGNLPIVLSNNNGASFITDNISVNLDPDEVDTLKLSSFLDFSTAGNYKLVFATSLPGDEDRQNDTIFNTLIAQPTHLLPFEENFENGQKYWSTYGSNSSWELGSPIGGAYPPTSGTKAWKTSLSGNYNNNEFSYLESECYNFEGNHAVIDLNLWYQTEAGKDGAQVEYSVDNGSTWFVIDSNEYSIPLTWYDDFIEAIGDTGWTGNSSGWQNYKQILPTSIVNEPNIKFRIKFASDAANPLPGVAVDDLRLYVAPVDVGVVAVDSTTDDCQYSNPEYTTVTIRNFGVDPLEPDDTLIVGINNAGTDFIVDTFLVASLVNPGNELTHTMTKSIDNNNVGSHQLTAFTLSDTDPYFYFTNNDTLIKTYEIWQNPVTDLVDTISSRLPDTVVIYPNVQPEYSFYWYEENSGRTSTNTSFDVDVPGTVYVTVTESDHGCQTFDSVYIELLFNDVGIDSIIWPQSSCELSSDENIQLQVKNFGTDSLIVDDKIYLYYEFNGQPVVSDSLILDTPLHSGEGRWFTFEDKTEDLSLIGDYTLKAYTDYGGDTIPENDTIFRTISVYGYPDLDLGNDTSIIGLSYFIEVDPSFESYLWNDGNTNSSRIIDVSGKYWLDVLDNHGCPASDTINIWFKIRDIEADSLISPVSSCNRSGPENITLRIKNNGTDTLYSSDNISLSYKLNNGTRVTESVNLSEFIPGQTYDHTFAQTADLSAMGNYTFDLTAVTNSDLRTENDTIRPQIVTNSNPDIDLGVDENEVYYVTSMVLDAGYDPNWIYLWQDGSTGQTYTVTDITDVKVLVTDTETGCYGGDTVRVYLDILDYMVTSIGLDASSCSGEYNDVPVNILNNGNLARQGAEITLEYYMDGQPLFTDNFENVGIWQQGTSRIHTTQHTINLQNSGNTEIEVLISADGDLRPENDDYSRNINVIPSPEIDFGGDELVVDFPYTLDAGSGYASYLWSDGSTGSTYTATEPGTYSVTVTGTNSCVTTRSVYLTDNLYVSDLAKETMQVDIYPNPASNYITIEASFEYPDNYILEIFNGQNSLFISRKISESEYKEEFYIGDLPSGLYFIRIRNDLMYHVSKMIIQ